MKRLRQAARVDANQASIVADLRDAGCDVIPIGSPVDLLVGFRRRNYLFEVKRPAPTLKVRADQQHQAEWIDRWRGQCHIIRDSAEAFRVLGIRTTA